MPVRKTKVTADKTAPKSMFCAVLRDALNSKAKNPEEKFHLLSEASAISKVTGWVPIGITELDWAMSDGKGVPLSKCIEIYGNEATGKTSMVERLCKRFQAIGGDVKYLDFESSLDEAHLTADLESKGIDPDRILYSSPPSIEVAVNSIYKTVKLHKAHGCETPLLIVWDSVAGSPADAEIEADAGDNTVAVSARAFSKFSRRIKQRLAGTKITIIFTNQIRSKIGGMGYGEQITRPGGKALDFMCDCRIKAVRIKTDTVGTGTDAEARGFYIMWVCDKNRLAKPFRKAVWYLSFTNGPDAMATAKETLKRARVIKLAGKSLKIKIDGEEHKITTKEWTEFYKAHRKDICSLVIDTLNKKANKEADEDDDDDDEMASDAD